WRSWQGLVGERESGIQVIIATVEDLLPLLPIMCLHRHVLLQCHPLKEILSLLFDESHDCEDTLSCPALLGARENQRPPLTRAHLADYIVSASILLNLVIAAAVIVC
ncbi:hypothetical protein SK128_008862, partial [Halocaridina rubra]